MCCVPAICAGVVCVGWLVGEQRGDNTLLWLQEADSAGYGGLRVRLGWSGSSPVHVVAVLQCGVFDAVLAAVAPGAAGAGVAG